MKSAEEFLDTFKKLNSDFSKKRRPLTKLEMNTPTPRTDAHINENMRVIGNAVVCHDFARQLERELADAQKDRDEWKAIACDLVEFIDSPPDANCKCLLSPPCSDCVDYGHLRDALARFNAKKAQSS